MGSKSLLIDAVLLDLRIRHPLHHGAKLGVMQRVKEKENAGSHCDVLRTRRVRAVTGWFEMLASVVVKHHGEAAVRCGRVGQFEDEGLR